MLELGVKSQSK